MDIKNQTASGNSKIENIETQININGQSKLPDKYLTVAPSKVDENQFLHRKTQREALTAKIKSSENHVFITGFGGIGKTAIVRALYHDLKNEYDYIAWIKYSGNLKKSILEQMDLHSDIEHSDSRWQKIQLFLTACGDKLLFFVDNITEGSETGSDLAWLKSLNAHLFITSRLSEVHNFEPYNIDFLTKDEGIDVFYCYYKYDKNRCTKEIVSQLVALVSCHTLSLELLAGIANSSEYGGRLEKLLDDLRKKGFDCSDLETISAHNPKSLKISKHFAILFEIALLSVEKLRILGNFQIIPKGLLVPRKFSDWIKCKGNALEELVKSGWISFSIENGYSMHDIVWETVKLQLPNIPYEDAKMMIKTIVSGDYFNDKNEDEHTILTKKIQIAEAYAEYFPNEKTEEWGCFLNLLGGNFLVKGEYSKALEHLQKALDIVEECLGKDHLNTASIYNNMTLVYRANGKYDKALEYSQKALTIAERCLGKNHPDIAITYNNIALVHRAKNEHDKALKYSQKALTFVDGLLEKNPLGVAVTYSNMATEHQYKRDYDKALEYFQKALDIVEECLGKDHPDTATIYNNIALVYKDKGEHDEALEYLQKALSTYENRLEKDHPSMAATYNNMANVYQSKGKHDKALEHFQKALSIAEKKLGKDHPDTVTIYNSIALVYKDNEEYDKALEFLRKALTIVERNVEKDIPRVAMTYDNMALVYQSKEEYDKALDYFQKVLDIKEKMQGIDHPSTATLYTNIGSVYQFKGEYDKALEHFQKALPILEKHQGKDHLDTATLYNNIAFVYYDKGRYDKALEYFQKALPILEKVFGKDNLYKAILYNNMASVYLGKREHNKALEYSEKALDIFEKRLGKDHPNSNTVRNNLESLRKQLE